jgi:hypothetical protein
VLQVLVAFLYHLAFLAVKGYVHLSNVFFVCYQNLVFKKLYFREHIVSQLPKILERGSKAPFQLYVGFFLRETLPWHVFELRRIV